MAHYGISISAAARRAVKELVVKARSLGSDQRRLPDFLIIGAQKAGTTSLYDYLVQHPSLQGGFAKEVHYFDGGVVPGVDNFSKGEKWYKAHFPLTHQGGFDSYTFEATPQYLYHPLAPARIYDLLPGARLLLLLRNPVERAISHYAHSVRHQHETESITDALRLEEQRLSSVLEDADYKAGPFRYFSYKSRGLYAEQIVRYQKYFRSEQMLVLSSEEFFLNPSATLKQIFTFLGIDSDFVVPDMTPRNVSETRHHAVKEDSIYLDNFY